MSLAPTHTYTLQHASWSRHAFSSYARRGARAAGVDVLLRASHTVLACLHLALLRRKPTYVSPLLTQHRRTHPVSARGSRAPSPTFSGNSTVQPASRTSRTAPDATIGQERTAMTASLSVSQECSSSCEDNAAVPHEADPEFEANRVIHNILSLSAQCGAWTSLDRQDATLAACGTYVRLDRTRAAGQWDAYVRVWSVGYSTYTPSSLLALSVPSEIHTRPVHGSRRLDMVLGTPQRSSGNPHESVWV